jgi:heme-degrading monooxygenase HmoA
MVIVVFRSRTAPGYDAELARLGTRMYELAATMPGFLSYREYQSADGESVALVEFDSHENLATWRNHPEHVQAQKLGRERYFTEYEITVCNSVRRYSLADSSVRDSASRAE